MKQQAAASGSLAPRVLLVCLAVAMLVTVAGCRNTAASNSAAEISLDLKSDKVVGPATLDVILLTQSGQPISGAEVSVQGDMSHAGMAPVLASTAPERDGVYSVNDFNFTMGGDWIITVTAKLPGGGTAEKTFNVNGVK